MIELIGGLIATGVGALAGGAALSRMLLRYRNGEGGESDSSMVSLDRYAALSRLTAADDERFLRKLPGCTPEMVKRLRRDRRAILRAYLREVAGDFRSLHRAARRLVAEAPEEHAELVGVLFQQQVTFWRCLTLIEVRLALEPFGLPQVDVAPLLEVVEFLRSSVAGPAPASPATA